MILSRPAAARLAEVLASLDAVHVSAGQPFFYTSGWASPVYVDARALISEVAVRGEIMDLTAQAVAPLVAAGLDAVVGVENSGIAFAAWLAERLHLPLLYLRKRPIGWGVRAQLEGRLPPDGQVLLVDDATTDGLSKIEAATALRQTGTKVSDVLVMMEFSVYPQTAARLAAEELNLHAMTDWAAVFAALRAAGKLSPEQIATLEAYTADPLRWSVENGGVGA